MKIFKHNDKTKSYIKLIIAVIVCIICFFIFYTVDFNIANRNLASGIASVCALGVVVCLWYIFTTIVNSKGTKFKIAGFFKYDDKLESYKKPIIMLIICVICLLIIYFVHFDIENRILASVIEAVRFIVVFGCIFRICISVCEFSSVAENRKKKNKTVKKAKEIGKNIPLDEVLSLVSDNDIIEIEIIADNKVFDIGASSDCNPGDSEFFDKLFYIDSEEFAEFEEFKSALTKYSANNMLFVTKIDGVKIKL